MKTNKQKTSKYFLALGTLKSKPNKNGLKIYTYIYGFSFFLSVSLQTKKNLRVIFGF